MSSARHPDKRRFPWHFRKRRPGVIESLAPVAVLILLLVASVLIFDEQAAISATDGPSQIALMIAGFVAAIIAFFQGARWHQLEQAVIQSIGFVTQTFLILLLVGALIGTWILGGIVPTLVVWGLELLSPEIFLPACTVISAAVALATGSSWSTAGTIGIALIGIGNTMGIHPGMSAGAIISGAYFGDKMSPFSETTNLSASMVGVDLFAHIRHMVYTTGPGFLIALALFFILGRTISLKEFDAQRVEIVIAAVRGEFNTSLYMLVPMVILFGMVAARTPAIPSLLVGSLMGIAMAIIFQPEALVQFAGASGLDYAVVAVKGGVRAAAIGYASNSGVPAVDDLLSRGGMVSMLTTVWLIMSAMFFSGIMEGSGMLHTIAESILNMVRGTGNLILATVVTAIFMNLTTSDQYMSIVISGRMYTRAYDREGLAPENLSRVLEDAGTLTSPLVPWNTCGAFMARTLSVPTWEYLPFAFLNLINPLISILYGYTGFTIHRKAQSADAIESGVNEHDAK